MIWRLESSTGSVLSYGGLIHDASAVKLKGGSYTVSVLLRHPDPAQLSALKDLPLMLLVELPKKIELPVYNDRGSASAAGHGKPPKVSDGWLRRGGHTDLYVGAPTAALPKSVVVGDVLVGNLMVDREVKGVSLPLAYEAPPAPIKAKEGEEEGDGKDASGVDDNEGDEGDEDEAKAAKAAERDQKALDEAIRDAKLGRLTALRKDKAEPGRYAKLAATLLEEAPGHLPLLLELLAHTRDGGALAEGSASSAGASESRAAAVGEASAALVSPVGPIDVPALAQYFGVARDPDAKSTAAKEEKKEREQQRKALRLALFAKAHALLPVRAGDGEGPTLVESPPKTPDAQPSAFVAAVREMRGWVTSEVDLEEVERDAYARTLAAYELEMGRPGASLKILRERAKKDGKKAKDVAMELVGLYRALGLDHWVSYAEEQNAHKFPTAKVPL